MKHQDAIAVATELKDRLKSHIDKGHALLQQGVGMESYKDAIQFNAIADDMLRSYAGNRISVEAFDDTSIKERVISMESLLGEIASFLRIYKAKPKTEEAAEEREEYEPMIKHFQWLATTFATLVDSYTPKQGSMTLGKKTGPYFTGDPTRFAKDYAADTDVIYTLFKRSMAGINPAVKHYAAFDKGLQRFIGDADRVDDFIAYIKPMIAKEPKPFKDTFNKVSYEFLAIGRIEDWFGGDDEYTTPYPKQEVSVPYPTKQELIALQAVAVRLAVMSMDLEATCYSLPMGLDLTDPPFRGYMGNATVQHLTGKTTMTYPLFIELHVGVVRKLDTVVEQAAVALISYLRKALA